MTTPSAISIPTSTSPSSPLSMASPATVIPPLTPAVIMPPKIAFISGPILATPHYFTAHYAPLILTALADSHHFVLGPSAGIDTLALQFLSTRCDPSRISVYLHRGEAQTLGPGLADWQERGRVVVAGTNHTSRDEAMTRASHYDILRYFTVQECKEMFGNKYRERISGTEKNERRRKTGIGLVWQEAEKIKEVVAEMAATVCAVED